MAGDVDPRRSTESLERAFTVPPRRARTADLRTLYCLYMPDTVHDVTIVVREQK